MDPTPEPVEVLDYARKRQSWYSLPRWPRIAILAAVILGLAIVLVPREIRLVITRLGLSTPAAKVALTTAAVGPYSPLSQACDLFQINTGRTPASLNDLVTRPANPAVASGWKGPYLRGPAGLTDPWGRPYRYRVPSTRKEKAFDLWSLGPDGINGSADDILN